MLRAAHVPPRLKRLRTTKPRSITLNAAEGEPIVFVHGTLGDLMFFEHRRKPSQLASGSFPTAGVITRPTLHLGLKMSILLALMWPTLERWQGAESHSSASRCVLLWRVHRARAGGGSSGTRAQPGSREPPILPLLSARPWEKPRGSRGSDGSSSHHGRRLRAEISRKECDDPWTVPADPPVFSNSHNL